MITAGRTGSRNPAQSQKSIASITAPFSSPPAPRPPPSRQRRPTPSSCHP
uniref:Uncharacterized protein n=1 Tax=Ralstonia solanacearum TaxID=305 RepID=O82954_RALSL|nr:unnamed protein product [Ralstonia solanacearum]